MGFTGKTSEFLNTVVTNDGFFPDLNLGDFQRQYRVPAEYQTQMVVNELKNAIETTNFILQVTKTLWRQKGANNLAAVVDSNLQFDLVERYQRAVFCLAKAYLLRQFSSMLRKESAENLAKESEDTYQQWVCRSRKATRSLMGLPNVTAELI